MTTALETRTVSAVDGTKLGLHSLGKGPDLAIVHGAMQSGASHRDLAELLSDRFRVHLFDRRGRGLSGDLALSPSTAQEVSDLGAVLDATGAERVFGVSSGGVVAARAALADSRISRLALFEPPISVNGSIRLDLITAVERALDHDQLPRAMGLAMKVAEMGPRWMFSMPAPVLALASRPMLRSPESRRLAYAVRADFTVVAENAGHLADFAALTSRTLLLNGTATRPYLRQAVATLARIIPDATHAELDGQNHGVTGNLDQRGHPEAVAQPLSDFFTA